MALIEQSPDPMARPVVPQAISDALGPEVFRQLYVGLTLPPDRHPAVIGVTSAISGEGRTTVALGLAETLAADLDAPVLLVEADLDRPALATHFSLPATPGLCEALRGDCTLAAVTHTVSETLSVITTGIAVDDSARLLHQFALCDPIHTMPGLASLVILDLPPLIPHSYAALAAGVADAVALVVRAGVTPAGLVREAVGRLGDCPPQGVVLTAPRTAIPWRRNT